MGNRQFQQINLRTLEDVLEHRTRLNVCRGNRSCHSLAYLTDQLLAVFSHVKSKSGPNRTGMDQTVGENSVCRVVFDVFEKQRHQFASGDIAQLILPINLTRDRAQLSALSQLFDETAQVHGSFPEATSSQPVYEANAVEDRNFSGLCSDEAQAYEVRRGLRSAPPRRR